MKKRILVVDDETDLLELLVIELTFLGYEVASAQDYDGAVVALSKQKFDFLLSDIRMPGKDGMELLRYSRRFDPTMTVILMTGFADVSSENALGDGAVARLEKPFAHSQLMQLLERHSAVGSALWRIKPVNPPTMEWVLSGEVADTASLRIGNGGLSLTHKLTELPVGASVNITIENFKAGEPALKVSGEICWQRPFGSKVSYGVCFAGLDERAIALLERHLLLHPTCAFIPAGP